ncbi:hypothetical protein Raf01_96930 [Rugosimonospora africana]|uniref:Uncharacterized protein n=1 Tax=Rugosimonospora africana TaxID=556532 RepID=A0A8J3VX55_9ACTN|nr:hypothetical protein Raf01_96930 [Rugosimonospora africana]
MPPEMLPTAMPTRKLFESYRRPRGRASIVGTAQGTAPVRFLVRDAVLLRLNQLGTGRFATLSDQQGHHSAQPAPHRPGCAAAPRTWQRLRHAERVALAVCGKRLPAQLWVEADARDLS